MSFLVIFIARAKNLSHNPQTETKIRFNASCFQRQSQHQVRNSHSQRLQTQKPQQIHNFYQTKSIKKEENKKQKTNQIHYG